MTDNTAHQNPSSESDLAANDPRLNFATIKQIQERYDVSHMKVWEWINSGQLKIIRLGERTIRISKQAELDFIARREELTDTQTP